MTRAEFLHALEEQLEIAAGSLREDQALADVDAWDSMASVLFIALADERVGVHVGGNEIAKARTVRDLLALLGDRLAA